MSIASEVTCFVIVAESVLESRLLHDVSVAGARGYTVTTARGRGPRGRRVSEAEGGNVRVELLVGDDVAQRLWDLLQQDYFPHYAVTAWTYPVTVARNERYT